MPNEDAIFHFDGLKRVLTDMGYQIEEATAYKPIDPVDVGVKELTESFKFTKDGIIFVDEFGEERQVFLYKRNYHLEQFGKPRYHICKCATINQFISSGSFQREYRATNAEKVPVANMDANYEEVTVENLPLCKYCQQMMNMNQTMASNSFVELLKNVDGSHNKNSGTKGGKVDIDIFGYTRDWEELSQRIREERNFTCEHCGIHIEEMSDRYYIHVHHVNGNKADNRSANLKCLCIRCHSRVDDKHRLNFSRPANKFCLDDFNKRYPEE